MKLSILMPVYNESETIAEILKRVSDVNLPIQKEIIVVDDCSKDGTREKLKKLGKKIKFKLFLHKINRGKGGAVKTALSHATGDIIIFQDADLEYYPRDYQSLIQPILEGKANFVLGNRFNKLNHWEKSHFYDYIHYLGNRFQSVVVSFLYLKWIDDAWTCYKVFKTDLIKSVDVKGERFDYEIELIIKVLKKNPKLMNIPIHYSPRKFDEGKKITWKDGFKALVTTLKYRFFKN